MAEEIKVPAGVYDMVTRCMEQEFPDNVAIRYVAADGKTVVEKKYREYAQDIRRMTAYLKAEVPGIKGQRVALLSRNSYEYCVASFGIILAGGVLLTLNQKKTWDELEYELGLVEPALILNDGIDYGYRAELEAAYGPKLRPMDCYRDTAPGELTNCIGHDDLMMLMFTSGTTGRKKNLIILASGENVSPEELEKKLALCPAITECIVKEKGQKICAVVCCPEDKQEEARAFVTEVNRSLPLYKRISAVEFTTEPLPRNALGKLLRK